MFGTEAEINEAFASIGKFVVKHEVGLLEFIGGSTVTEVLRGLPHRSARNVGSRPRFQHP
jgi:hypothetical protein